MLSGAHVTLVSTMDHLAVANLLEGRTQKALKMLRRIYELQKAAHGPKDPRCFATRQKIMTIRSQQVGAAKKSAAGKKTKNEDREVADTPKQNMQPAGRILDAVPRSQPADPKTASDGSASRGCTGSTSSNGHNSKVNTVFKAIRSLGRRKN